MIEALLTMRAGKQVENMVPVPYVHGYGGAGWPLRLIRGRYLFIMIEVLLTRRTKKTVLEKWCPFFKFTDIVELILHSK